LATVVQDAATVVNSFWARHWSDYFTGSYSPPSFRGLYTKATAPDCGGDVLAPDNAAYCTDGDYLAFGADLMALGLKEGNALDYLVVAHEWGHAVQARLRSSLRAQAEELQADCLAGAALYGAAGDGDLTFEGGDEKVITKSLSDLADSTAWTSSSDHGDPFQRIESFDLGRTKGVAGCVG
jgi:predicted metalloprotease